MPAGDCVEVNASYRTTQLSFGPPRVFFCRRGALEVEVNTLRRDGREGRGARVPSRNRRQSSYSRVRGFLGGEEAEDHVLSQ